MNPLTRKIRNKGYTLLEFCEAIGFSLRWYRTHEWSSGKKHVELKQMIDELEDK